MAIGAIIGGLTALGGAIWGGVNRNKQLKRQKKLDEQAAGINYKWNEKAAQDAYNRSLDMYEKEKEYNSPKAQRDRLKEAGMSTGLMYGSMGTTGGANVGQMAQGGAGGAAGGAKADSPAEEKMANMQAAGMAIQIAKMEAEMNKTKAETDKLKEDTETTKQTREATIEELKQRGMSQWIDNIGNLHLSRHGTENEETHVYGSKLYGDMVMSGDSYLTQQKALELAEVMAKTEGMKVLSELNTEKKKIAWQELINNTTKASAIAQMAENDKSKANSMALEAANNEVKASAQKLAVEWQTGEQRNWKTWKELATEIIGMLQGNVNAASGVIMKGL